MKKMFLLLSLILFLCIGSVGHVMAYNVVFTEDQFQLPVPAGDGVFDGSNAPIAVPFGDFFSYSLPMLAFFYDQQFGGGVGPGNPYYVNSTPGAIKDEIVLYTGADGVPVTTNASGMDDAYPTPSGDVVDKFTTGNAEWTKGSTPYNDPGHAGEFLGDDVRTWDIQLSALDAYLDGSPLVFFFNNNQYNSVVDGVPQQNLYGWGQVTIVDVDGSNPLGGNLPNIYFDFTNNNAWPWPPVPSTVVPPYDPTPSNSQYVSPGPEDNDYPFGTETDGWPDSGDFVLSGGPVTFYYNSLTQQETIQHNLGADQAAYAIWSPEIDGLLAQTGFLGYDVMQIDFRMFDLNNGYEQLFILRGEDVTNVIPEPGTMLLLGTGLIGLAGLARRRFVKKS